MKQITEINEQLGRDAIEVRHAEQPLRGVIIDTKSARLKEVKSPEIYKPGELKNKTYLFYDIHDAEWIEWLQKVFWHIFRFAPSFSKRLDALKSVKNCH